MLAGFFIGSVFFVRIGDLIGRRPIVIVSTIVNTLTLIFMQFLAPTLTLTFIYIFIFGMTVAPRCFLSFVWAMELTPKEHHLFYSTMAMIIDSACMIFLGFYFWSVKSMGALLNGLILIQIVIIALLWFFIPESAKFLYEKGRIEEFLKALKKIARVNGNNSD